MKTIQRLLVGTAVLLVVGCSPGTPVTPAPPRPAEPPVAPAKPAAMAPSARAFVG